MKTGIELIAEERQRQITAEGWTAAHDDDHDSCELAKAAAWYALPSNWREHIAKRGIIPLWPWTEDAKPGPDRVRELTKAGALIAAEIDRLQRQPSDA